MEWINSIQGFLGAIPITILLVLFIRYTLSGLTARIDSKVAQAVYNVQIKTIEGDIEAMNKEIKESFNKLLVEMKEQRKDNGELKVELTRLTQKVEDSLKNNMGAQKYMGYKEDV